jgi:UDP-N-acetylglucosamine--N-acetylmuramyl-(pentapeptide) pyrophosphoryl-undecaprenol N-acetylglucosamine transferase
MGGSLGAHQLNLIVDSIVSELTAIAVVIHQTGHRDADLAQTISRKAKAGRYCGKAYFSDDFGALLQRADLAICRAGAGTIWELAVTATPAILVPLGAGTSRGDQIRNAARYAEAGAAIVVPSDDTQPRWVTETVRALLGDRERLRSMAGAARRFGRSDAAELVAMEICRTI